MSSLHQQLILEEYIDFLSNRSDHIFIEAVMGLVTGMTASSPEMSNNFSFKSIGYQIIKKKINDNKTYH